MQDAVGLRDGWQGGWAAMLPRPAASLGVFTRGCYGVMLSDSQRHIQ
jgi:hypothetical protein